METEVLALIVAVVVEGVGVGVWAGVLTAMTRANAREIGALRESREEDVPRLTRLEERVELVCDRLETILEHLEAIHGRPR